MLGVFPHTTLNKSIPLVCGYDDVFVAPHSRHTEIRRDEIVGHPDLELLCESQEAGVYIVMGKNRMIFITGHAEYDPLTLQEEYERDLKKSAQIEIPKNYFLNNDPGMGVIVRWRSHAQLLFSNWLNYYVYQSTPYDIDQIR